VDIQATTAPWVAVNAGGWSIKSPSHGASFGNSGGTATYQEELSEDMGYVR
jgi:hypothetical protein